MSVTTGLIFFRHSQPEIDLNFPAREWHLSEEGRRRCRVLADQLANFNPHQIVSSLEPKAVETAQIVAETLGLSYETADGLHEHIRGRAECYNQKDFEASVRSFFEQPDRLVYGEETANQAHTRFARAVEAIRTRYASQSPLVIVTHGTVISLFVARTYGIDPFAFWKSLKLPCIVLLSTPKPRILSLASPIS